jgi:hypothetical protein
MKTRLVWTGPGSARWYSELRPLDDHAQIKSISLLFTTTTATGAADSPSPPAILKIEIAWQNRKEDRRPKLALVFHFRKTLPTVFPDRA